MLSTTRSSTGHVTFLAALLSGLLASAPGFAQSESFSQISELSMEPSEASAAVVIEALPAGSHLVVTALRPVGKGIEISAKTTGHASITGLRVSAVAARKVGLAVGGTLTVSAVGAGWMISEAGQAIAFVPDRLARSLTHHEEL